MNALVIGAMGVSWRAALPRPVEGRHRVGRAPDACRL